MKRKRKLHIQSLLKLNAIQSYQSVHPTHLQAIYNNSTHSNHTITQLKKKKKPQTNKKRAHSAKGGGGPLLDHTKVLVQNAFRLLIKQVCFQRRLAWGDGCGLSNGLRDIVVDSSGLKFFITRNSISAAHISPAAVMLAKSVFIQASCLCKGKRTVRWIANKNTARSKRSTVVWLY